MDKFISCLISIFNVPHLLPHLGSKQLISKKVIDKKQDSYCRLLFICQKQQQSRDGRELDAWFYQTIRFFYADQFMQPKSSFSSPSYSMQMPKNILAEFRIFSWSKSRRRFRICVRQEGFIGTDHQQYQNLQYQSFFLGCLDF